MGAMKAIYTDIQELQANAAGDEDSFISYIEAADWTSPTENEIRQAKASKLLAELDPTARAVALRVLDTVGMRISTIDFPFRAAGNTFGVEVSAA